MLALRDGKATKNVQNSGETVFFSEKDTFNCMSKVGLRKDPNEGGSATNVFTLYSKGTDYNLGVLLESEAEPFDSPPKVSFSVTSSTNMS